MTSVSTQITINEVHPNPISDAEWVELQLIGDPLTTNLNQYTLHDSTRQIYQFTTESFNPTNLLVVSVSGLNNDQDRVILKDTLGTIIDEFSYTTSTKGLSWARMVDHTFVLTQPSKGETNPHITPSPTPTTTPAQNPISPSPTTITPSPKANTTTHPTPEPSRQTTNSTIITIPTLPLNTPYAFYALTDIQLATTSSTTTSLNRLVLIEASDNQLILRNAIITSLLVIVLSSYLLYVKYKTHST